MSTSGHPASPQLPGKRRLRPEIGVGRAGICLKEGVWPGFRLAYPFIAPDPAKVSVYLKE